MNIYGHQIFGGGLEWYADKVTGRGGVSVGVQHSCGYYWIKLFVVNKPIPLVCLMSSCWFVWIKQTVVNVWFIFSIHRTICMSRNQLQKLYAQIYPCCQSLVMPMTFFSTEFGMCSNCQVSLLTQIHPVIASTSCINGYFACDKFDGCRSLCYVCSTTCFKCIIVYVVIVWVWLAVAGIVCFKNICQCCKTTPVSYTQTNISSINLYLNSSFNGFHSFQCVWIYLKG